MLSPETSVRNAPMNLAPTTSVIAGGVGAFLSSSTCTGFPCVMDCLADKLQIQYCVLGTGYWVLGTVHITDTTLRNTLGVRLPATVS